MTSIVVLLGALAGAGLVLVALAVRGTEPNDVPRARTSGGITLPSFERLSLRIALAVGFGVVIALLTAWPVGALMAAVAGFFLPSVVGGKAARAAEIARIEGIAGWAEMLRDTMAGAGGLEQSIIASAVVAPPAIRDDVLVLAGRLQRERMAPALRQFAASLDDATGDLVVAALLLAADKSPKRLGELLGTLSESARGEVVMRLRVDAGRARSRTSVRVVTISTVTFALGLVVLNRGYLDPYDGALGQGVLALVGLCFGTAFWWLARAGTVDVNQRFLSGVAEG